MKTKTFIKRFNQIMEKDYKRFDQKLVNLINEYMKTTDIPTTQERDKFDQIDYASGMEFSRKLDNIAERRGWVEDRLNDRNWSTRKATKKIRKVLGYSYP